MRPFIFSICMLILVIQSLGQSRKIICIPDIPGYHTLKCDFHTHTIFSDGTVWPTVRVEEAWRDGLDAISITDHIEYRPHSKDVEADHNRSFQIAEPLAKSRNILLIKGAEITRNMPPGHFNTLFIKNANLLDRENVFDALREARDQGAFIIWNHPGWKAQQPDTTLWWDDHTRLLNNNMLHGIEVFNYNEYYPEAMDWAMDKKLTLFANTDTHNPIDMEYDLNAEHRPMTLVFSKSRTEDGIREALFSRRTVAWYNNTLVGKAGILEPLFFASLQITASPGLLRNGETRKIELANHSDIDYELELVQPGVGFDATTSVIVNANKVSVIELSGNSDEVATMNELKVYYRVKNMMLNSRNNLVITFSIPNSQ
ncbi:MAG: histidinol-phosphatase [Bacteroidota bacterium]